MKNILISSLMLLSVIAGCSSDSSVNDEPIIVNVDNTASRFLSSCTNVANINETVSRVPNTDKHLLFEWNNSIIHDPSVIYTSYIEIMGGTTCLGTFSYTFPINFFGTSSYYRFPKFTDRCFRWRIVIDGSSGCHSETEWHEFSYANN